MKPKEFWMDTDILDKALDNCDLGDSYSAKVRQYPHKDMLSQLTHVIEYKAYAKLEAERASLEKEYREYICSQYIAHTESAKEFEVMKAKLEAERDMYKNTAFQAQEMAKEIAQSKESWRLRCMNADDEANKLMQDRTVLVEALNSIIAKSHSWLITRETGMIEKPIHDSYRNLAKSILQKIGEVKE